MPNTNCRYNRGTSRCVGTTASPSSKQCEPAPVLRGNRRTCRRSFAPPGALPGTSAQRIITVCATPSKTYSRGGLNISHLRAECTSRGLPTAGLTRGALINQLCAFAGVGIPPAVPFSGTTSAIMPGTAITGTFLFGKARRIASLTGTNTSYPRIIYHHGDGHETILTPAVTLGGGTYGQVIRYAGDDGRDYIVKVERMRPFDTIASTEHPIIGQLTGVTCGQILARVIGVHKYHYGSRRGAFSLLDPMDGDLASGGSAMVTDYRNYHGLTSDAEAAAHIVNKVRRQVTCLLNNNNNHVFADMKVQNVMFRRVASTGEVQIKVGDLGSLNPDAAGDYVFTYPCLPTSSDIKVSSTLTEKRQCLAYQLGLLLAELLGLNILPHYWGYPGGAIPGTGGLRAAMRTRLGPTLAHLADLAHQVPGNRPSITVPFV